MPLDAGVILKRRELEQQGNRDLAAQLQQYSQNQMQQQQLEMQGQQYADEMAVAKQKIDLEKQKMGFDIEPLYAQYEMAKAGAAPELTPQQMATLRALDKLRASKMTQNPLTGEMYQPYRSILTDSIMQNSGMARTQRQQPIQTDQIPVNSKAP